MPAAHALMHAEEDATRALQGLTTEQIWMKRSSAASIGYHLRHIAGSIDRLCTYARTGALTEAQQSQRTRLLRAKLAFGGLRGVVPPG